MFRLKNSCLTLCSILLILFVSSCADPDKIGLDLQPTSEIPVVGTIDTFDIQTYTVKEDSLVMYATYKNSIEAPTLYLGSLDDPNVGKSFGGFASQVRVGNTIVSGTSGTFGSVTNPDSIVLSLAYKSYVGDTTLKHSISVYELTESLANDSTYYSGRVFNKSMLPIGHIDDFIPNFTDSISINGVNLAPHLRIPLYQSFGNKIMTATSTQLEAGNFLSFIKGIVVVDSVENGGCMITMYSNSTLNRLTLYYTVGTTPTSYEFVIDGNVVRTSFFHHEYNSDYLDTLSDVSIVTQSMAGLKTKCKIVDLSKLYANGKVAIASAKVKFVTKTGTIDGKYVQHNNLLLLGSDSLGKNTTFIDALESSSYFGGSYDQATTSYTFNIARYLQRTLTNVVDKGQKDYGFYLIAGGSTSNAQRTVLEGGSSVKLIVTYTKVNP